jgi:hypothetical protein
MIAAAGTDTRHTCLGGDISVNALPESRVNRIPAVSDRHPTAGLAVHFASQLHNPVTVVDQRDAGRPVASHVQSQAWPMPPAAPGSLWDRWPDPARTEGKRKEKKASTARSAEELSNFKYQRRVVSWESNSPWRKTTAVRLSH